ncbi:hypothetical protein [Chryseobacterium sp.]|uniref:hypothetical protein n=1 Tax=Chryseobacterium sp. TaxID=1871047 RepID=UPI0025C5C312|nr:hypothetical protein [Chryseobacterium sp.]MBV8328013.1 hypothetical protein [Chryseobacterium sp.]
MVEILVKTSQTTLKHPNDTLKKTPREQEIIRTNLSDYTMKTFNLILVLLFLSSCYSQQNPAGIYRSKEADFGFFITTIELKNDHQFNYEFSGDLVHRKLSGIYQLKDHHLYLKFNKNKRETESQNDSLTTEEIISGNYHNHDLNCENNIDYHLKYKIRGHKLFAYRTDNKPARKSKIYTHKKKFLFFGSHWKNKRNYLKKIK